MTARKLHTQLINNYDLIIQMQHKQLNFLFQLFFFTRTENNQKKALQGLDCDGGNIFPFFASFQKRRGWGRHCVAPNERDTAHSIVLEVG